MPALSRLVQAAQTALLLMHTPTHHSGLSVTANCCCTPRLPQERALAVTTAAASAASLATAEQQLGEARNRAAELAAELAALQEREAGLQQQLTEAAGRLVQVRA